MSQKQFKQPEIFYEEEVSLLTNGLPFIKLEKDNEIPSVLFIAAMKDAELNDDEEQVVDIAMQMYVNSEFLKRLLSKEDYNKIRKELGFKEI